MRETKHWFLPLDRYEEFLSEWILKGHKNDWKPNVYGQCKSWIEAGLKPRAVTRDLDWGIPVPLKGAEGKVLYVWFDAPIGYISSTREWAEREKKDWEPYWKDKDSKLLHFIGKDNIVFHCIIFPAMLKAHGEYVLPDNVPANEFLNLEGNKLSTSKNWAVWLHEYLEEFPGMQDVLRYALTANAPESKDNDFTWKDFQARNNNELVAIYGNFINRVVVLTHKYFDGIVPEPEAFQSIDKDTFKQLSEFPATIADRLERYRFREASQELINLARLGNKYLAEQEPWKVIKEDEGRVKTILYVALQIAAGLAVCSDPFLPFTAKKLRDMLGLYTNPSTPKTKVSADRVLDWEDVQHPEALIPAGHQLAKAALLFRKIEDEEIQAQLDKLQATKLRNETEKKNIMPQKETISFEDFSKIDMRVGTILEAEKMPKTKKLMVLKVDTGLDQRTIVSGIAESFTPEEIIGRKVTVLVNLAARPLRGVDSEGMILMTESKEGKLVFLNPDEEGIDNGETIS
jgi:methionyl-tRNA synthetase